MKSGDLTGKLSFKDDKPDIKGAYHRDLELGDQKIKLKAKARNTGDHDLRLATETKISDQKVKVSNTFHYNNFNGTFGNTFQAFMRLKDLKARGYLQVYCADGDAVFTSELAKRICDNWQVAGQVEFSWKDKETKSAELGVFYNSDKIRAALVEKIDVAEYKKEGKNYWQHKTFQQRTIFSPNKDTSIGYDYNFDFKGTPASGSFAFQTKVADDISLNGRVDNEGNADAVVRADFNDDWSVFFSQGFQAKALAGKGEANFGIGIRGNF